MKLLHIDSSILGAHSASRELSAAIVARWRRAVPGLEVVHRDLGQSPLPHLDAATLAQGDADAAAGVIDEFLAADVVVLGVPMYNFNVPSQLKAWIDRIAVAGRTFRYGDDGAPIGLAGGKQVLVAGTYGGVHPARGPSNFIEPYLRFLFGFLGIDDVRFVTAEGLAMGPDQRARAMAAALGRVDAARPLPRAA